MLIASDLWQQLEFASEFEPDLQDAAVDWQRKWLGDFNAGFFGQSDSDAIDKKMDECWDCVFLLYMIGALLFFHY